MGSRHISEIVKLKEKNQKKNNKATGHSDTVEKYSKDGTMSSMKSARLATEAKGQDGVADRVLKREARYIKNLHIDACYDKLRSAQLIDDDRHATWRDWYFKVIHTLGASMVMSLANYALTESRDPSNPRPLFHYLINKEMNRKKDLYAPRV